MSDSKYIQELEEKLKAHEQTIQSLKQNLEKTIEEKTFELRSANEKLSLLVSMDPLTDCMNRRGFETRFQQELDRSLRYHRGFVLAMIDIDDFKRVNDSLGHAFGDRVLKVIAKIFSTNLRKTDLVARIGGDEFVLLLPETSPQKAEEICNRLKTIIQEAFDTQEKITASFGMVSFPESGKTITEILEKADAALYSAKESGKNKVVLKEDHVTIHRPK